MQRAMTAVLLACVSAYAAQPASVVREGKAAVVLPRETRSDAGWARELEPLPTEVQKASPKKLAVNMSIDRSLPFNAVVSEPKLGIDVDVRRDGGDFALSGYLKAHGWLLQPPHSLSGVALMGGGINIEVRPSGSLGFTLSGPYKKEDGSDGSLSLRVEALGLPVRDLAVRAKGLDLQARWSAKGYAISGAIDQNLYGKRELAIVGGALAALTDDLFR